MCIIGQIDNVYEQKYDPMSLLICRIGHTHTHTLSLSLSLTHTQYTFNSYLI